MPDEQRIHDPGTQPGKTRRSKAKQVGDEVVLAAVDRAIRHERCDRVCAGTVVQHLGLPLRSPMRPRLRALTDAGLLTQSKHVDCVAWCLSAAGRRKLRAAGTVELPESPQHVRWREARALAEQECERVRLALREGVERAGDLLDDQAFLVGPAPTSEAWLVLNKRLERETWQLASIAYCLHEWAEPDDAEPDVDERRRSLRNFRRYQDRDES